MHRAPLIVIDLDDVLCQTTAAAAEWHNEVYGTRMVLGDFHYYHWWQNPCWGEPLQAIAKAQMFYASVDFLQASLLPDAEKALQTLRTMGFRLAILTSRSVELRRQTTAWINKWLPGVFESIQFTGDFVSSKGIGDEIMKERRLSKGNICRELGASVLIDDSVENVLGCANSSAGQTPALLLGDYEWGKRSSTAETAEDMMSFNQRQQHELALGRSPEWWKEDIIQIPEGIWRVKDWPEVLLWLQISGKDIVDAQDV
ncbi:hypothetical protein JB92DRAFT_2754056 [Gautieria morchelliformis]|nr:hypothetical protein JB92DRAFT_2754056 [Gautieria morchelliformis]